MEMVYKFNPDEIIQDFNLIGETFGLGSQRVKTGKGRRMYDKIITSKGYDDIAQELITKSRHAYTHGLKNPVYLSLNQIKVLKELVVYCVGIM